MINRKEVVDRHSPIIQTLETFAPLSIGNSEFAFSVDLTGLQSFPEKYKTALGTQANWGWHSTGKRDLYMLDQIDMQELDTYGRKVAYPRVPGATKKEYHWLRQNPHRVHLGQLGFVFYKENGEKVGLEEISHVNQKLDLWQGMVESIFEIEGKKVQVYTVCHPDNDEIAVQVKSELLKEEKIKLALSFPNPNIQTDVWEESVALNWYEADKYPVEVKSASSRSALLKRSMDEDYYEIALHWSTGRFEQIDTNEFLIHPDDMHECFTCSIAYATKDARIIGSVETFETSKKYWKNFWQTGGMVDFSGSTDHRAKELERRVILSQYLTAIHSGGALPPQETGLMYNSWFGKFHLEMHWWHASHFPLWERPETLEKSLKWYQDILPEAKKIAESQGYTGARWPKMTGPDGKQSPSEIAVVLIWQQPHPIALCELVYRTKKDDSILQEYKQIIFETADFLADYPIWDDKNNQYVLGPPLIPAQENHQPEDALNPPFELEYWKYALDTAIKWKERLNEDIPIKWIEVSKKLAPSPHRDHVYLAHENCPSTYSEYNHDHPSMVAAFGLVPSERINKDMMKETLNKVKLEWQWETSWGWDFPMCAMTATRLGEPELAIDFLLMNTQKNTYLINGHNYQHESLTAYLPGNGGLLTAIAMMVAGWDGQDDNCPGIPKNGNWKVKFENIQPYI